MKINKKTSKYFVIVEQKGKIIIKRRIPFKIYLEVLESTRDRSGMKNNPIKCIHLHPKGLKIDFIYQKQKVSIKISYKTGWIHLWEIIKCIEEQK